MASIEVLAIGLTLEPESEEFVLDSVEAAKLLLDQVVSITAAAKLGDIPLSDKIGALVASSAAAHLLISTREPKGIAYAFQLGESVAIIGASTGLEPPEKSYMELLQQLENPKEGE